MTLMATLRRILPPAVNFVDVGAYQGEFTQAIISSFPNASGLLFEPTPRSFEQLKKRFEASATIRMFDFALAEQQGVRDFFFAQDSATNSLLPFADASSPVEAKSIKVETLDSVLSSTNIMGIDLIKIDTQGNDLRVLHGARGTIKRYQPVLLVEAIFVPLYLGQASYYELFDFMRICNYRLGGIFESHWTEEGAIAYADILFLPSDRFSSFARVAFPDRFVYMDPDGLLQQNRSLHKVCEERLELIQKLTVIAEERQAVIETLDAEVKRLSAAKKH